MEQLISNIDEHVYDIIISMQNNICDNVMLFITSFASAMVLITIAILSFIVLKKKRYAKLITLNLIVVFVLNRILKLIFARERPQDVLQMVTEDGYSFPSAHTMIGTAFYGFIIYLISKKVKTKWKKNLSIALLTILIILIGISRIYLGAHYATDVIAGILFAIIYLIFFIKWAFTKKRKKERK